MDTDSGSKDIAREGLSAAYKKETRSASYLQDFFDCRGSFTSQFRPALLTLNTYYKEKEISHSSNFTLLIKHSTVELICDPIAMPADLYLKHTVSTSIRN
ncbi:hypothetical protein NC651_010724 [Populus alba x Populus x berolinensis]|nr:hypothetical protein NC651_010724 [Populus alba x Populus x berolinensis]